MLQNIWQEFLFNVVNAENTKAPFFLMLPIFEKVWLYLKVFEICPLVHLIKA
jgi:hypothetical protein